MRPCAYLGLSQSTTILTIMRKKFLSTTFKNIKPPHRNRPHRNLHLIGLPRGLTPFWRALLIARHCHFSPQLHPNLHRSLRGMLSLSMGFRRVMHLRTLCSGGRWVFSISLLQIVKKSIIGPSTRISHHRMHGPRFPGYSQGHGSGWAPILEVPSSLHGPALNSEGENSHGGYVHQRVAAGGSYEVGLSVRWV